MKFLNESGLTYFFNKLKSLFITKTDFNKIYNDGVIDAKQIVHKTNSTNSTNYDLFLGDADISHGSFIEIDSIRTTISNGDSKAGIIYIYSDAATKIKSNTAIELTANTGIDITANSSIENITPIFKINEGHHYPFIINRTGRMYLGGYKSEGSSSYYINIDTKDSATDANDKIQFLVDKTGDTTDIALDIRPTKIKAWTNTMQLTKDKEIRFRTSASNSIRLTEGEGFKVFANMYAMPDNATDISEFAKEEQNLLADNSVQKLLLKLNKNSITLNDDNKIDAQWIPNTVAQGMLVFFDTDYIILTNFLNTDKNYAVTIMNSNIKIRIIDVYVCGSGKLTINIPDNETTIDYFTVKTFSKGRYRILGSTETNKVYIEQLS